MHCKHSVFLAASLSYISPLPKIQLSAKDFENEKIDRQSMQHQLHKVLKELRKARDQIAKLESAVSVTAQENRAFIVESAINNSSDWVTSPERLVMISVVI